MLWGILTFTTTHPTIGARTTSPQPDLDSAGLSLVNVPDRRSRGHFWKFVGEDTSGGPERCVGSILEEVDFGVGVVACSVLDRTERMTRREELAVGGDWAVDVNLAVLTFGEGVLEGLFGVENVFLGWADVFAWWWDFGGSWDGKGGGGGGCCCWTSCDEAEKGGLAAGEGDEECEEPHCD